MQRQSRIGSPADRHVPPRDVDGATLFVARNGRELREFLFVDTEQAYQAADLALLAQHLVRNPVDQAFDQKRRLFLIVNEDGSLATIAIYRNADIAAWSLQETDGRVLSVAVVGDETMLLVDRPGGIQIERLDDLLMVDAGLRLSQSPPALVWTGLGHLEGQEVALVADGLVLERTTVSGGQVVLDTPASELVVGLPYRHVIEPMPASPQRRPGPFVPAGTGVAAPVRDAEPAHRYRRRAPRPASAHHRRRPDGPQSRPRSPVIGRCARSAGAAAPTSRPGGSSRTRRCPAHCFLQPRK